MSKAKRIMTAAALALLVCVPIAAQLGPIGSIVHDPLNMIKLIEQIKNQIAQIDQMVKHYEFVLFQAKYLPGRLSRWGHSMLQLRGVQAVDTYGINTPWQAAANGAGDPGAGYALLTEGLEGYGALLATLSPTEQARIKRLVAAAQLQDGASTATLGRIGDARALDEELRKALLDLKSASLSDGEDDNTMEASLNTIQASTLLSAQQARVTNDALLSIAEQQTMTARRERDAIVEALNNDVYYRTNAPDYDASNSAGITDALGSMRMIP